MQHSVIFWMNLAVPGRFQPPSSNNCNIFYHASVRSNPFSSYFGIICFSCTGIIPHELLEIWCWHIYSIVPRIYHVMLFLPIDWCHHCWFIFGKISVRAIILTFNNIFAAEKILHIMYVVDDTGRGECRREGVRNSSHPDYCRIKMIFLPTVCFWGWEFDWAL